MKGKLAYEELTKIIRDISPKAYNPDKLTDSIMKNLPEQKTFVKKGISISSNIGHWRIFIGFRAIAAIAAVLLIGFFAFQQWEIMSKVSQLESEVNGQRSKSISLEQVESAKASYFKTLLGQPQFKKKDFGKIKDGKDSVLLDRRSLNQLLQLIEQLEQENRSIKNEIIKQYKYSNTTNEELNRKSL